MAWLGSGRLSPLLCGWAGGWAKGWFRGFFPVSSFPPESYLLNGERICVRACVLGLAPSPLTPLGNISVVWLLLSATTIAIVAVVIASSTSLCAPPQSLDSLSQEGAIDRWRLPRCREEVVLETFWCTSSRGSMTTINSGEERVVCGLKCGSLLADCSRKKKCLASLRRREGGCREDY